MCWAQNFFIALNSTYGWNSVDSDQFASSEASWSGSTLFKNELFKIKIIVVHSAPIKANPVNGEY